jgi:two-component system, sensor histidine kinase
LSDPVLIERILGNLLSNAIRYTPAGRIMLACRKRGERLRIEVRDSGIGIPADARTIIFQEFVQLDNPERARDKGLGLGLAIVRRLTDLLGHRLEVRSSTRKGFGVCHRGIRQRPGGRFAGVEPDAHARRSDGYPHRTGGRRSTGPERHERAIAPSWGCEVVAAHDAKTLFDLLASADGRVPQVVLCDFRLAEFGNGIEAIRAIRARFGTDLPAALITGDTGPDVLGLAHDAELPLLHKPVRPARLRALLNRLITNCD